MTVSTLITRVTYGGNGVQTTWSFPFAALDPNSILTAVNGVNTLDRTVTLNSDQNSNPGGEVVFDVPPPLDATVVISRLSAVTQQTSYPPFTRFPARDHEEALDKLTLIAQEQWTRIDDQGQLISLLTLEVEALDLFKADKSIEILSANTDLITIANPTLADNVTITPIVNAPNALLQLDGSGLVPVGNLPPIAGLGDFRADGSVPMTGDFVMNRGANDAQMYLTNDVGDFWINLSEFGSIAIGGTHSGFPAISITTLGSVALHHASSPRLRTLDQGASVNGRMFANEGFTLGTFDEPEFSIGKIPGLGIVLAYEEAGSIRFNTTNNDELQVESLFLLAEFWDAPSEAGAGARNLRITSPTHVSGSSVVAPITVGAANPVSGQHLAIGRNGIQGKANGTTPAAITINAGGGDVQIGTGVTGMFVPSQSSPIHFDVNNYEVCRLRARGIDMRQPFDPVTENPFPSYMQLEWTTGVEKGRVGFVTDGSLMIENQLDDESVILRADGENLIEAAPHAQGGPQARNNVNTAMGRIITATDIGIGSTVYRRLTSTVSDNSATFVNVTDLDFSGAAGQAYEVSGVLFFSLNGAGGGGGLRLTMSSSEIFTTLGVCFQGVEDGGALFGEAVGLAVPEVLLDRPPASVTAVPHVVAVKGVITFSSVAATINVRFRQSTASAGTPTFLNANSFLRYTRIL